jgi:hypothetical protein
MSEHPPDTDALQAAVAALHASGAWRADRARFFYLEAMARRLPEQPQAVQRILADRMQAALAHFSDFAPPAAATAKRAAANPSPLARLNEAVRAPADGGHELASVRRFRRAWDSSRTLDQVERAVSRRPANAGPLNSHMLVLQSLEMMRTLAPEYLQHFLAHVESLQWLERASETYPRGGAKAAKPAKPARRAHSRK